jgi:prepilin-type N-terminal cleavage/methylation domain-containing protein
MKKFKLKSYAALMAQLRSKDVSLARKAFTLVEVLLVLAVATAIIVIGLKIYSSVQENSKITQTATDVGQIRGAVESLYQGQGNFASVTGANIQMALPPSMWVSPNLVSAFQGVFDVAPATISIAGDSYSVVATNLDQTACLRLATTDLGRSLFGVSIDKSNGTAFTNTGFTVPVSPANAATLCTGVLNSVGFQFH